MGRLKWSQISVSFQNLWKELFTTPVHLDSALSRRKPEEKSSLATLIRPILLQPASLCKLLGIHLGRDEPWKLSNEEKALYEPVFRLAEELWHRGHGLKMPAPIEQDFPNVFRDDWATSWGKDRAAELVQIFGQEPALSLRVRRHLVPQEVARLLSQEIADRVDWLKEDHLSPLGLSLRGYAPVLNTDTFKQGSFEIQDQGSQMMAIFALWPEKIAPFLKPVPGEAIPLTLDRSLPRGKGSRIVIDACAGAGGKTLAIADLMENSGRVYAYDVSEKKLLALRQRGKRAGYNNVQAVSLVEGQEQQSIEPFYGKADVVLVDAPCSGWGVLRRNPDLKWRQKPEELIRLKALQIRLLHLYAPLVAPGGRLVFGVCTLRRAETTEVVLEFSQSHPDFRAGAGGFLGPHPISDGFFMQEWVRGAQA